MRTKHVSRYAEAYLNNELSLEERRSVEEHLAECPTCTRHFFHVRRLYTELKPLMEQALGKPHPPPALRYKVHRAIYEKTEQRPQSVWLISLKVLNAAGGLAVVVLLTIGLIAAIQKIQSPPPSEPELETATAPQPTTSLSEMNQSLPASATTEQSSTTQPALLPQNQPVTMLHDTLSFPAEPPQPAPQHNHDFLLESESNPQKTNQQLEPPPTQQADFVRRWPQPEPEPPTPFGMLAFATFDPHPQEQQYQIQLLNLADNNLETFPLAGVSEPALKATATSYHLIYRAWGNPTRALLSSNLTAQIPDKIADYWEDAHPDWSPTENRLLFASQREGDRKWRLYTAWADGSFDKSLHREGKSPTFAPDGQRFAFESWDDRGEQYGLWLAEWDNIRQAQPFLLDDHAKAPDWSPVGEQIAYMAQHGENWDLYMVDSDGENKRRLTEAASIEGLPTWSPDGEWLAFLSDRSNSWGIWLLHVETQHMHQVYDFGNLTVNPETRISPFGTRHWWDEQLSWSATAE